MRVLVCHRARGVEDRYEVLTLPAPAPRKLPPEPLLVLEAEDFRGGLILDSPADNETCILAAIAEARRVVGGDSETGHTYANAIVTGWGSIIAAVRWNLDVMADDVDPPVEVIRFASPATRY
jgi:hypothetical protein